MNCDHAYKRLAFGIGEKVWSECTICGWREDTGNIVVSADRIAALEAALRDVLTFSDITKPVDADGLSAKVRAAWQILGSTAETPAKSHGKVVPRCTGEHDMEKTDDGIFCRVCGIADYQLKTEGKS